ncbi:MAG: hypothetical protein KDK39_14890 [Leptospiraceae bacterium]|nr:hypothetical protein [Leptospiraceae bacterium]
MLVHQTQLQYHFCILVRNLAWQIQRSPAFLHGVPRKLGRSVGAITSLDASRYVTAIAESGASTR